MPQAVTHVLLTIILVDLFRDYFMKKHKRYITLKTLFIAGVGGILPDIDIPLYSLLNFFGIQLDLLIHGGILHAPIFALIVLIPGFIFWQKKKHKQAVYFFVLTFGILFHIFLDYLFGGGNHYGIMWLWPFSVERIKIHLFHIIGVVRMPMAVDALILLLWLWHENRKHKIKDYI